MAIHSDNGAQQAATSTSATPAADAPRIPEEELRRVLAKLAAGVNVAETPEWETVGAHVLRLAERDARLWPTHASEYVGAFAVAVIEFFRNRPEVAARASRPWALAVIKGRLAAQTAVGAEALCGLTYRDPVKHRIRMADAPRVISLDRFRELDG